MGQTLGANPTVVAVATPPGVGGISVIRISGPEALNILSMVWKGKSPHDFASHTAHLGWIMDSDNNDIDQVLAVYYKAPNSYTGEDVVELSCHGSPWILQSVMNCLLDKGASAAGPGEFTRRAFINGRLDLAQAEGVADLIAASSRASARLAVTQLKGEFSSKLKELRQSLVDLGSLLELELDFSEEDVEFADRDHLISLSREIRTEVRRLACSYHAGKVFKNGIPVVIAGVPNVGKSSLLNSLLEEDKAIVSAVAGTTRDIIEDTAEISGILFRFYDTAGLRASADTVETMGVERARKKISEASIILRLIDPTQDVATQLKELEGACRNVEAKIVTVLTKKDLIIASKIGYTENNEVLEAIAVSSKTGEGLDKLKEEMVRLSTLDFNPEQELVVTNARHYEALKNAINPLDRLIEGLESGISADFLAQDLREASHFLGNITGEVSSTDILHTIFSRYCIGK